jgi:predicted nucleic acid-binding protein
MTAPVFVDTNVLVYARDGAARQKQPRAQDWLAHLWHTRRGRVSYQVLNEYYTVVTRKLKPGMSYEDARADVRDLLAWRPQIVDHHTVEGAWKLEDRFGFPFRDALIVATARAANCGYLLSEDLSHGQQVDGVQVLNPFLSEPATIS